MKKDILKLFYIPVIGWIIVSILYFLGVYFLVHNYSQKHIIQMKNVVINEKKKEIKREIEDFKRLFYLFQNSIYSSVDTIFNELIKIPIKNNINKLLETGTIIVGLIPEDKRFKYEIYKNKYIILDYHNKKYLVVLHNKNKKIYILGIRKKFVDNFILEEIKKYLDKINRHRASYIALGKILTLNPGKNGNFGYLYYMPPKLKYLEGLTLSVNKTDMKGHLFRQKYLECFKKKEGCFVSYYWRNPLTNKIEEKISYFVYLKDYNFSIIKGIYKSQIISELNKKIANYKAETFNIFKIAVIIYFVILIIFMFIYFSILSKVKIRLLRNYESLKRTLIRSFYYDSLTKLPNRNKLMEDLYKYKSLVLLDIDNFSDINDVFGFDVGDKILKELSLLFNKEFKNVYRIGGDEFAIGFKKYLFIDDIAKIAAKNIIINNLKIDVAIGASNYKNRLYESAEMALKFAFKVKDKKYVLYDKSMYLKQKEKLDKINILKKVLEKKDIIPYYQCIVDTKGNITKYEALMRIKINDKIESPFFFMDLIKEAKLYSEFSKVMISKVLKDVEKINNKVSINLSYDDIANEEMRNFILSSLNEKNASKIVFEILESESILNYEIVKSFIFELKKKGVKIAIDDFGSGYSNFVQLLNLEPDIIKIDSSLIKNIENPKTYKMVELMVSFATSFNLQTVAEFVSNKKIFDFVKDMGIDEFQGYYFCEPQPLENIIKKDKISSKKGSNEN